jgi:cell division inhibitor SulA
MPISASVSAARGSRRQVLRLGRVGVVVGEVAVDLAEQRHDVAAEAEQFGGDAPATPLPQSMTIFIGRASLTSPTMRSM